MRPNSGLGVPQQLALRMYYRVSITQWDVWRGFSTPRLTCGPPFHYLILKLNTIVLRSINLVLNNGTPANKSLGQDLRACVLLFNTTHLVLDNGTSENEFLREDLRARVPLSNTTRTVLWYYPDSSFTVALQCTFYTPGSVH